MKLRNTRLPSAKDFSRASHFQILLSQQETVGRLSHDFHAALARLRLWIGNKDGIRLLAASADTASQLMKLAESEAVRIHDDHHRSIRDVDSDLNDRGRDQNISLSFLEVLHNRLFFLTLHLAMKQSHFGLLFKIGCQFFF